MSKEQSGAVRTFRCSSCLVDTEIEDLSCVVDFKLDFRNADSELFTDGQADSLITVVDTPFGKVGGLSCWEHTQPLLRYYEYSQGVEIHVAGWPSFWNPPKDKPVRHFLETDPLLALEDLVTVIITGVNRPRYGSCLESLS